MKYSTVIKRAQAESRKDLPDVSSLTTLQLHENVAAISKALSGFGIDAYLRLRMNEDRKAFRAEIERRGSKP